jgi:alpha-N-arabinofuranosidase
MKNYLLLFSFLIVFASLYAKESVPKSVSKEDNTVRLLIDCSKSQSVISPLLFGHNLEHTRKAIWQGLGAQMVVNRKFAAADCGMPMRWNSTSGKGVAIDETTVYAGKRSVRLDGGCGIRQQHDWLTFQKGRKYVYRLWAKAEGKQTVSFRIVDRPGFHDIFYGTKEIESGDWTLFSGEFTAPLSVPAAKLEIVARSEGTVWIGAVSLMPADNFHGMRRDVIELFKQMKPSSLRWPGGCFAEYYDWKEGLLPVDKRAPTGPHQWVGLLPDSEGYDDYDIGIDEYIALCRELGCLPVITTRFGGGGSVEETADWVEYCNGSADTKWGKIRADRGFPQPYNVKYWYVGNEIWGMSLVKNKDPKACGALVLQHAKGMKQKDPSIRLAAGIVPNQQWLEPVFGDRNGLLDMVQDGFYFDGEITLENVLKHDADKQLLSLRQALDTIISDGKQKPITFYEWNVMWDRRGDAASAIFAAKMLNSFCRNAEKTRLEMTGYFQPITEGAIRVQPATCSLDADGMVYVMFAAHQNNQLLEVSGLSEAKASGLDVCASINSAGNQIFITVVNSNKADENTLDWTLPGKMVNTVDIQTLTAESLEDGAPLIEKRETFLPKKSNRLAVKIPPCSIMGICLKF